MPQNRSCSSWKEIRQEARLRWAAIVASRQCSLCAARSSTSNERAWIRCSHQSKSRISWWHWAPRSATFSISKNSATTRSSSPPMPTWTAHTSAHFCSHSCTDTSARSWTAGSSISRSHRSLRCAKAKKSHTHTPTRSASSLSARICRLSPKR